MATKHIGVLTGGGDVPGLNAAIKSVYTAARDQGWLRPGSSDANVTGILRGWKGAVQMGRDPQSGGWSDVLPLDDGRVRTVDRSGGTFLHTSRTRPDRMLRSELPARLRERAGELPSAGPDLCDATGIVIENLTELGIDCLIAIVGGVIERQMSNEPGGTRWIRHLDRLVDMYLDDIKRRRRAR